MQHSLPLWKQIALIAVFAVGCIVAAAMCILAFVAFSAAWGPVK